jgi:AmmeMemoRadiSam system protein B
MDWYPQNKEQLNKVLDVFLSQKGRIIKEEVHGLIVPHAGYAYSGEIAGKAYSLLKNKENNKNKTAIILSPSHYFTLNEAVSHNKKTWQTPLGTINILNNDFKKADISQEHAIDNQLPFLQKLGFKNILPLLVGEISLTQARNIAKELLNYINEQTILIISTDLSHFLPYEEAKTKDSQTIDAITKLNSDKLIKIENCACGIFPLSVMIELCKIKHLKPKLLEYKNSGDITGDKSSVVGYVSMAF